MKTQDSFLKIFTGLLWTILLSNYTWADAVNLNQVAFETALYHFDVTDSTMDPEGNTYLVGTIKSGVVRDSYAPVVPGGVGTPALGKIGVAKVDPNGRLVFTYYTDSDAFTVSIAGNGTYPPMIVVDKEGNIIVATSTGAAGMPTVNAAYPDNAGNRTRDVFLFKINSSGTLIFSTYFGSSSDEYYENNTNLAVDSKGNIYIGGYTYYMLSDSRNFPLVNPLWSDLSQNTGRAAFLAKFSPQGQLLFSTALPPRALSTQALVVDQDDNLWIGVDLSGGREVCSTLGTYHPIPGLTPDQSDDLMVAKISGTDHRALWCTQFGGWGVQSIHDMAVDQAGNVVVGGFTSSRDFLVYNGHQMSRRSWNGFLTKFDRQGSLVFSTTFGAEGDNDEIKKLAIDSAGNIYAAGEIYWSGSDQSFPMINRIDVALGLDTNYERSNYYHFLALFSPLGQPIRSSFLGTNGGAVLEINAHQNERINLVLELKDAVFKPLPDQWITGTGTLYCHDDAPDHHCNSIFGIPSLIALGAPAANPTTYTLTVAKTGQGTVTSNRAGINCGAVCTGHFNSGTSVTLTANPDSSFSFSGWSGDCNNLAGTCVVSMDTAKNVTALFVKAVSSNPVTTLITHYYQSITERTPDAGGLAFWQGLVAEKQAQGADVKDVFRQMAEFFFFSPEYLGRNTTDRQFITNLYLTFFQRLPDEGGYAFWLDQLARSMTRNQAMGGFLYSPEFTDFMERTLNP